MLSDLVHAIVHFPAASRALAEKRRKNQRDLERRELLKLKKRAKKAREVERENELDAAA